MCPKQRQQTVEVLRHETYNTRRKELFTQFQSERKKLEDMVTACFEGGKVNLGTDVSILKQSVVIDRLIVDSMKLDELCARHKIDDKD